MEKIEVVYKPITDINGKTFYHKYILYTDSAGKEWGARGGPQNDVANSDFLKGEAGFMPSPFGRIDTQWGPFAPGFSDFTPDPQPNREIVLTGPDLSQRWRDITRSMDDIKFEQHTYRPVSQNSNSTVDEVLRRSGIPQPVTLTGTRARITASPRRRSIRLKRRPPNSIGCSWRLAKRSSTIRGCSTDSAYQPRSTRLSAMHGMLNRQR